MKTSERLIARLREAGADLPPCAVLVRTNRNRRTGIGAWSWAAHCAARYDDPGHVPHRALVYGSHWSMSELLAAEGFTFQDLGRSICIDPVPLPGMGAGGVIARPEPERTP
jgi:hypothetical protein